MVAGQVDTLFRLARASAKAGRKSEARRLLWSALRLAPDRADLWMWLAGVAASPRASLGYLARALTLDPRNPHARAGLRWARQRVAASHAPEAPPALPSTAPTARRFRAWGWAAGAVLLAALTAFLVTVLFFPDLPAALAAWESPLSLVSAASQPVSAAMTALPARVRRLPPTWTPTSTARPTKTPTATPTVTPSPTVTPTPVYPSPTWVPTQLPTPAAPGSGGERWVDVDLTHQLLIVYEGSTPVRWVPVSTGLTKTPTVVGRFRIYAKYLSRHMVGDNYDLPRVPYTMYFYKGYALHGTYWHSNFGRPMSHGCVNMPTSEAEWLYSFASVGTLVIVHY